MLTEKHLKNGEIREGKTVILRYSIETAVLSGGCKKARDFLVKTEKNIQCFLDMLAQKEKSAFLKNENRQKRLCYESEKYICRVSVRQDDSEFIYIKYTVKYKNRESFCAFYISPENGHIRRVKENNKKHKTRK